MEELVQEFAMPEAAKADADAAKEDEKAKRERLVEEQRIKAAEAEERKKRRNEQAERKRQQAAESAKRIEAERKERDRQAREAAAAAKTQAVQEEEAVVAAAAEAAANKTAGPTAFEKRQQQALAKRPKTKAPVPLRTATKFWQQYQAFIIFAVVMLFCVILGILFLMS